MAYAKEKRKASHTSFFKKYQEDLNKPSLAKEEIPRKEKHTKTNKRRLLGTLKDTTRVGVSLVGFT